MDPAGSHLLASGAIVMGMLLAQTPSTYDARLETAVKACQAIDRSKSQSGLYGNPDGYRSYYVRSQCFQDAAVRFRDVKLCDQAKQRRSLFASSWGYSPANCRRLVNERTENDRRELEHLKATYASGPLELKDLRVERNGNGRDFDVVPAFRGAGKGSYLLTVEILPGRSRAPVPVYSAGHYVDADANLRLYVTGAQIRERLPEFVPGGRYTVRATLTLSVTRSSSSGEWSDAFIDSIFPARERSHILTRELDFGPSRTPAVQPTEALRSE